MNKSGLRLIFLLILNLLLVLSIAFFHRHLSFLLTGNDIRLVDQVNLLSFRAHEEAFKIKLPIILFGSAFSIFTLVVLLNQRNNVNRVVYNISFIISWLAFFIYLSVLIFYFISPGRII